MEPLINYKDLPEKHSISTPEELRLFFWNQVAWEWAEAYETAFPKHGEITLQHFYRFGFVIDHIWDRETDPELPETRVVGTFGIADSDVNASNRSRMQSYWGSMTKAYGHLGCKFDKGHFIAHGFGGPIDVNLFPQKRDVNRGWCEEGKRYRAMERFVAKHPGTLVFSRPLYEDLSCCPSRIEYGYCDPAMNIEFEVFPNR